MIERSDFQNSSFVYRHSKASFFLAVFLDVIKIAVSSSASLNKGSTIFLFIMFSSIINSNQKQDSLFIRQSTFVICLLGAHFQNKFGLKVDIILETVVTGQIPSSEGPHVAQYHNVMSRHFKALLLDTR